MRNNIKYPPCPPNLHLIRHLAIMKDNISNILNSISWTENICLIKIEHFILDLEHLL